MIEVNEPIIVSSKTYIDPNVRLTISGDPAHNSRKMIIELRIFGDNSNIVRTDTIQLAGEEFNVFYEEWLSDKDIFTLLKSKGLIPEDAITPEEDLLNDTSVEYTGL